MKKKILKIIINIAIIVLTVIAMFGYRNMGDGNMQVSGAKHLRFFTNLSNYLVAFSAGFVVIETIKELAIKDYRMKRWVVIHKFAGTIAVTITFLTVCFFLGPTMGYKEMFSGICLYLHLIVPVLAIISLIFIENKEEISKKECLFGLIPFVLYALVYVSCYLSGTWSDFYGFTFGGKLYMIPISLIVMSAFTLGLCYLERYLRIVIKGKKC